ncbi:hypothetical protein [Gryllotalpicola koreensis]|uniref:Holliday junction nuclease RuvC n=1 Tax=Gryllotalpicola koreensis TaxID=993086 RepID=A0ABP8A2W1_9MICO
MNSPIIGAPEDGVTEQIQSPPPIIYSLGIDLSLTGTGVTSIGTDGIKSELIKSSGKRGDSLADRDWRLRVLMNRILLHADMLSTESVVVIEQPAYSQTAGSHHDRSGLWWLIVHELISADYRVVEVSPSSLKKYATGKGNAAKDAVLAAVVKRYPHADVTDNNVADSLVLAAMGARHLEHPIEESLPVSHGEALTKVRWAA